LSWVVVIGLYLVRRVWLRRHDRADEAPVSGEVALED